MKVAGNGQGKILTPEELRLLFTEGFVSERDRALFGICLFTGCRVSEALALQTTDIRSGTLTFRKSTTKGKLKTRVVDIQPGLAELLAEYQPKLGALFPGMRGRALTLTRFMADKILKAACARVGLFGVSTHSFRRTALTQMSSAGIPLRHIQEISGHNDLGTLQRYLEVTKFVAACKPLSLDMGVSGRRIHSPSDFLLQLNILLNNLQWRTSYS